MVSHKIPDNWQLASNSSKKKEANLIHKDKTRQEADRSQRQPEGSFFYSFYRNLRHLPQVTAGVGATPIPLHAQLVASKYWYSFYPPQMDGKLSELWLTEFPQLIHTSRKTCINFTCSLILCQN